MQRFDYELPSDLIAQHPLEPRDSSRLLVVNKSTGAMHDRVFRELPEFLQHGDLIVVNDTRVIPARLLARRRTGGGVELLLLAREDGSRYLAMARPGRRLHAGEQLAIVGVDGQDTHDTVAIVERRDDVFVVSLDFDAIQRHGRIPLPPYIRETLHDPDRYQTVYARDAGSAAAPTAGMHFTHELIDACRNAGATFSHVTLHVGLDTFQPIKVDNAREHRMHSEWFRVPNPSELRAAIQDGRRIIAVGTTSVRTLEAAAAAILDDEVVDPIEGRTELFITPGYQFRVVDAMVTNFHLPRTTLMLLVSAFGGEDQIRAAYSHAVRSRYRFYSFGDAMLIV